MKNLKYLFGLSALTLMLGACSDDLNPEYSSDNLAVHFSAQVGKTVSRSSSESLASGSTVNISKDGDYCSYKSDNNGNLTPTGSDFIRWSSFSQTSMSIKAYTPVIDGASTEAFSLANLKDQSSATNLANADFASFEGSVSRGTNTNDVTFELQRRMTQVKINIASVDSRYTSTTSDKYTFDLTVYSPSTSITVSDGTVSGDGTACAVTPYNGTGIALGGTATAIITPGAASTDAEFIAVQVKKNGVAFGSPLIATGRQALNAGYSYTFNLTVNNDGISISTAKVTDWDTVTAITGGTAISDARDYYNINLNNYSSSADVYAEVKRIYEEEAVGAISFTGKIGSMTLRDFFLDTTTDSENPTWLPIRYINLSGITDLTEIPDYSFCYNTKYPDIYLKSITASQVTTIGKGAFYSCKALTSIDFASVTQIGSNTSTSSTDGAFAWCTSLEGGMLPKAENIGNYTFYGCSKLEILSLPSALRLYRSAFSGCSSLIAIDLPKATSFGNWVFANCTSLTSLDLPAATTLGQMVSQH
jgi:hypothetical protein